MTRLALILVFALAGCAPQPPVPRATFYRASATATTQAAGRTYDATVVRVVDGDTVNVDVALNFDSDFVKFTIQLPASIRIAGINAPEIRTVAGPASRDALAGLTPPGSHVTLSGVRPDKYSGRWDAAVNANGVDVGAWQLSHGQAVPYNP